jgi:hypothetical protein
MLAIDVRFTDLLKAGVVDVFFSIQRGTRKSWLLPVIYCDEPRSTVACRHGTGSHWGPLRYLAE